MNHDLIMSGELSFPSDPSYISKGSEGTACPLFYGSHVNLALISEFLNKWGVSIIATPLHIFFINKGRLGVDKG